MRQLPHANSYLIFFSFLVLLYIGGSLIVVSVKGQYATFDLVSNEYACFQFYITFYAPNFT